MSDASPVASGSRAQFRLTGPARSYDPTRQAIRPDLADVAEAEHHFAPHYALPAQWQLVRDSVLRESASDAAPVRSALATGAAFALLDLTGGWGWGYAVTSHEVGYVLAADIAPPDAL